MKPKVLLVSCEGLGNGGVQAVMMSLVRNMQDEFQFDMLLFTDERRYYDDEFEKYGKIFRIPNCRAGKIRRRLDYYIRGYRIYKGTRRIFRVSGGYQVVHCNNDFEGAMCILAAKKEGGAVRISHSHTSPVYNKFRPIRNLLNSFYRRIIKKNATDMIGCSKEAADFLFGENVRANIINNGIDLRRFDVKKYNGVKHNNSFIHIGAFNENKNQLFVVDIFAVIKKRCPDAILKLIGFGNDDYINRIKERILNLDLGEAVTILPGDSDVPLHLSQSQFMIFPSVREGFGLACVEAQVMEVMCYASDSIPEEVDIGLCEFISLTLSAEKWAEVILQDIKKNKKKYVEEKELQRISMDSFISKWRRIYQEVK